MNKFIKRLQRTTQTRLILLMALFFSLFYNVRFFRNVVAEYPLSMEHGLFLCSLGVLLLCATVLILALLCHHYTIKPVLIVLLLVSSLTAYFMDSYNVIIDSDMLSNVVQTDVAESLDLLSLRLLEYLFLLGLLPALYVLRVKIVYAATGRELLAKLKIVLFSVATALLAVAIFGSTYASFFREHKPLRFYTNPGGYLYAVVRYVGGHSPKPSREIMPLGLNARTPVGDLGRELIVFVVGETARSDRFSLNGYPRETNPLLKDQDVISFTDFWACGTSTAISVPCMFSLYGQSDYSNAKGRATENVLDVLSHAGVNVLWLDNNSDSKGVATRVAYASYKDPGLNPDCDQECRDVGMLAHLAEYIEAHPQGDIFIVLHQMGTHGPAYYKRYPQSFEKFTPVCRTTELDECSSDEIGNAYDNTILYTDYFLSQTISLLKHYDEDFKTAMFYVSDHGESLGENGVYLHGMPNFIAPDVQRKIPAIAWLGKNYDSADRKVVAAKKGHRYSHDHIFHTVLGMMEIETDLYDQNMDIFRAPSL